MYFPAAPGGDTTAPDFIRDRNFRVLGLIYLLETKFSRLVTDWKRSWLILELEATNTSVTSSLLLGSGVSGVIVISGASTIESARESSEACTPGKECSDGGCEKLALLKSPPWLTYPTAPTCAMLVVNVTRHEWSLSLSRVFPYAKYVPSDSNTLFTNKTATTVNMITEQAMGIPIRIPSSVALV